MSKEASVIFKKSVSLDAPARRKSSAAEAVQAVGSTEPAVFQSATAPRFAVAQTANVTLPLADVPWSEYVSRGACDLLSSSLNVAFDAVESHDLRAAMATAATLSRHKAARSPGGSPDSPSTLSKGSGSALPRIATAAGAAPPRMEMADFTLAYNLPQIPAWKLGYTPRFTTNNNSSTSPAPRSQFSTQPRDMTERAMEVDLRLPSPPSSALSLLSPFTACANERATRVQTALDRNNGPTKWEAVAALGGVEPDDSPDEGKDETSDWSHMLALALSRREQAAEKLKEMDEQLLVGAGFGVFSCHFTTHSMLPCRIFSLNSSSSSSGGEPGLCALRRLNCSALNRKRSPLPLLEIPTTILWRRSCLRTSTPGCPYTS